MSIKRALSIHPQRKALRRRSAISLGERDWHLAAVCGQLSALGARTRGWGTRLPRFARKDMGKILKDKQGGI